MDKSERKAKENGLMSSVKVQLDSENLITEKNDQTYEGWQQDSDQKTHKLCKWHLGTTTRGWQC